MDATSFMHFWVFQRVRFPRFLKLPQLLTLTLFRGGGVTERGEVVKMSVSVDSCMKKSSTSVKYLYL